MCLTGSAETEQSVSRQRGKIAQQPTWLHPALQFQPIRARQLLSGWVGVRREKETEQTKGEEQEEGGGAQTKQRKERESAQLFSAAFCLWLDFLLIRKQKEEGEDAK